MDKLEHLRKWLQERSSAGSTTSMAVDDDEEALLLSEGFMTFKIQAPEATAPSSISRFYSEPMKKARQTSALPKVRESLTDDMTLFRDTYFNTASNSRAETNITTGAENKMTLLEELTKELTRSFNTDLLPDSIAPEDFVYAMGQARVLPAIPVLPQLNLPSRSSKLWNTCQPAQVLPTAKNAVDFFIRHLVQASTVKGLYTLKDLVLSVDVYAALQLVVQFIGRTFVEWKTQGISLRLEAMTLHSLIVLIKEVEVLRRLHNIRASPGDWCESDASDLVMAIVHSQPDDSTMLNILDPIMTADPHLGNLADITHHGDVKRDLIRALYFQNPKLVAGILDTLNPGWESLVNIDVTAEQREFVISDRRLLAQVDDTLHDFTSDGRDVMERFRELTRCHPMLVLSRFPRQLMQHLGTVSLSQIYLNTTFFQNILKAMEIMRPHVHHQQSVLEPFCQFLFEILRVIADRHASEFHQLVSYIWEFFYDALEADFDLASELIFSPSRVLLLESIVGMYESHPDTVAFQEVIAQRHSEWSLRSILESVRGRRNKHHSASSHYQQVDQLLSYLASDDPVSSPSKSLTERTDMTAITQGLQAIDYLCSKTDQEVVAVSLLRRCASPVAAMLAKDTATKATMTSLCQTLLNLMKQDSVCVDEVMRQYIQCLRVVRPGLKETAVAYVLEFLVFADAQQRRQILQQLFDDPSEIAKTKLGVYLKSAAFRTSLLVASKPST
ncbi:hypothetical protein BBJ29_005895 [Phytophthora kernoviae]|uniref:Integrator complex subunit 1 R3 domain-containing protein n=1 Tax=Phytophthora kernoviae TaxID=325452 RepID=A0A3F2RXC6_9STRA|nr:hypothetical protein BBP00_00003042 [Phytophthora kernoviae]RLN70272.1 hypothetical protein BBJ29_005895 [Phytophthora kernoviae]